MKRKKGDKFIGRGGIEIEVLGEASDVTDEELARISRMTSIADEEDRECRVNFRWTKEQLAVVKAVADKLGIPYQVYIKHVLIERASEDLRRLSAKPSGFTYPQEPEKTYLIREDNSSKVGQVLHGLPRPIAVDQKRFIESIDIICDFLSSIARQHQESGTGASKSQSSARRDLNKPTKRTVKRKS